MNLIRNSAPLRQASGLKIGSAVTAPTWTDAKANSSGEIAGVASMACLYITVHSAKESTDREAATTELTAWAILPLFMPGDDREMQAAATSNGDQYLNTGKFQLPLFSPARMLRKGLVEPFAKRTPGDATGATFLKQFLKGKQVVALEGATAFVRIVDLQLPPQLQPTSKSVEDLSQLSIGPAKKGYTAPLEKSRAKSTFLATRPKKEAEKEYYARMNRLLARAAADLKQRQDHERALTQKVAAKKKTR